MEELNTLAGKICEALNRGRDPEALMIDCLKGLRGQPQEKASIFLQGLVDGGAAEVAMKVLFSFPFQDWDRVKEVFQAYCQVKFLDNQMLVHFTSLMEQGQQGRAMDFARKVDKAPFEAMEEAGIFDSIPSESELTEEFPATMPGDQDDLLAELSSSTEDPIFSVLSEEPTDFEDLSEQASAAPEDDAPAPEREKTAAELNLETLFRTLFETIMADGIITDVEKRFIGELRRVFNLPGAEYSRIFREVSQRYESGELASSDDTNPKELYRKIVAHAMADGVITPEEEEILFSVAQSLLIDRDTHMAFMAEFSGSVAEKA